MTLTEKDRKMIERLRRGQRFLARWRWPLAIIHICMIIAWVVLLNISLALPSGEMPALAIVPMYFTTPFFLLMAFSAGFLGYLILNWNGNPQTHLLLRLLDESQTKAP
ncbi:MAG TPA: hypothetical protein VMZ27_17825 [Candidatus Saccharimonadales bacterium]|nr:hypothetical protein [Candidatus Saccharimonadales bacterium]